MDVQISAPTAATRRGMLWPIFCILLALALRSHNLGSQSLWWDESLSLHRAQNSLPLILANRITLTDGETDVNTIDNHPPLYFLVLTTTARLLGTSEFALRLPSLVLSILLIPLVFATGRRLYALPAAALAALMTALSPMLLWYAQEARPYTLAAFLGLLSFFSLVRVLDHAGAGAVHHRGARPWALLYGVATVLMLLTHYLTFFVLGAELLVLALGRAHRHWPARGMWLLTLAAASTLILGYALSVMPKAPILPGFAFVPLPVLARDVLNSLSLGLSVNVDDVIGIDILVLLVAIAGLLAAQRADKPTPLPGSVLVLLYIGVPFVLTYFAGYIRPIYMNSRHLIVIAPAFYLAVGAGLSALLPRRGLFLGAVTVIAAGVVFSWSQYFTNPVYHKDDHRAWGAYLRANVMPGDVVVVDPPHIYDLYRYYADSGAPWVGLPPFAEPSVEATAAALQRLSSRYANIWLALSYTPPWGDPERAPETWLNQTLTKTDERIFHTYASDVRVLRYTTRPPLPLAPPPIAIPASIDLEGTLTFLGHDPVRTEVEPGVSLGYSVYWRAHEALNIEYRVSLRLLDSSGRLWAQTDQVSNLRPTERIRPGGLARDDVRLAVPLATPPGTYQVQMLVYEAASGRPLRPSGAATTQITLGRAIVLTPRRSPLPAELPIAQRLSAQAGPLRLIGIGPIAEVLQPGQSTMLEVYWQATARPQSEYLVHVFLRDRQGRTWLDAVQPPATPEHGTLSWQAGEITRGLYSLALPRDIPEGRYSLSLALEDTAQGRLLPLQPAGPLRLVPAAQAGVATVDVRAQPVVVTPPPIVHPVQAELGGVVAVLGYDAETPLDGKEIRPGQEISLTIHLQTLAHMDSAYSMFVHLVDSQERIWGQSDGPPGGSRRPTSLWLPSEVISAPVIVALRPDTPPGPLTVFMGLYDPATLVRLPRTDADAADDRVMLFTLQVVR